jgi:hypothetical protein
VFDVVFIVVLAVAVGVVSQEHSNS